MMRRCRDCGNCMDREPSEECMEVTAHRMTERHTVRPRPADMSRTEEAEKGYKDSWLQLGEIKSKTKSEKHINFQFYISFVQIVRYNILYKMFCAYLHFLGWKGGTMSHKIITIARQFGSGGTKSRLKAVSRPAGVFLYDPGITDGR